MNSSLKKQLNKYYRAIKRNLPCKRDEQKQLLSSLKKNVRNYLTLNPNSSMDDIYAHFGTVDEITDPYYDGDSKGFIPKNISFQRIILTFLITLSVCSVLLIATIFYIRSNIAAKAIIETEIEAEE